MKILSIDTTNKICSTAYVVFDDKNFSIKKLDQIDTFDGLVHSVVLFRDLENLINRNNIKIAKLDYIAVSSGPGSYTGLRIGAAAALGLAKPCNLKIKYVDTLLSLAYNIKQDTDFIVSMIDAKVNRVYFSIYDNNKKNVLKECIVNIDDAIDLFNRYFADIDSKFIFVGDGAVIYHDKLNSNLKINFRIADLDNNYNNASSVAKASLKIKYSKMPILNYMQKSQAERNKND